MRDKKEAKGIFFNPSFFPKNQKAKMNFSIPQILPNSRKGISMVVTSLIIILLVLVAVGIIWVVVQNIVSEGSEQISLGQFTIDLDIKSVSINADVGMDSAQFYDSLDVMVKRNPGEGELAGVKFVVTDTTGVSEVFENMTVIQELGSKKFNLIMNDFNASEAVTISIAPVLITSGGKQTTGSEIDEFDGSMIDRSAVE